MRLAWVAALLSALLLAGDASAHGKLIRTLRTSLSVSLGTSLDGIINFCDFEDNGLRADWCWDGEDGGSTCAAAGVDTAVNQPDAQCYDVPGLDDSIAAMHNKRAVPVPGLSRSRWENEYTCGTTLCEARWFGSVVSASAGTWGTSAGFQAVTTGTELCVVQFNADGSKDHRLKAGTVLSTSTTTNYAESVAKRRAYKLTYVSTTKLCSLTIYIEDDHWNIPETTLSVTGDGTGNPDWFVTEDVNDTLGTFHDDIHVKVGGF